MKKFVIIGALALAACSGGEEAADEAMVEEPVVEEVAIMAADGNPPEGTFEISSAEGDILTQVVNADGTYANLDAEGNEINVGTWSIPEDGLWCSAQEGQEEICFNESVDADGVWTSVNVNDPEDVTTVVRVN